MSRSGPCWYESSTALLGVGVGVQKRNLTCRAFASTKTHLTWEAVIHNMFLAISENWSYWVTSGPRIVDLSLPYSAQTYPALVLSSRHLRPEPGGAKSERKRRRARASARTRAFSVVSGRVSVVFGLQLNFRIQSADWDWHKKRRVPGYFQKSLLHATPFLNCTGPFKAADDLMMARR
jgi:hypothetical protein